MEPNLSRRHFLAATSGTALIPQVLAATPDPGRMKAGTAKVDITPDRPRYDVEKVLIDPPTVYHPVHARCLTLHDGARRMVFVTYDLNCLDYATPILRERVEKELGIPPAYLVLLATHNHPVHARCLTLHDGARRMVFVTYDLNCLDYATPILRERVEKELGIPPAYLVL